MQERLIPVPYSKSSTDQAVSAPLCSIFHTFAITYLFCLSVCLPIYLSLFCSTYTSTRYVLHARAQTHTRAEVLCLCLRLPNSSNPSVPLRSTVFTCSLCVIQFVSRSDLPSPLQHPQLPTSLSLSIIFPVFFFCRIL